MTVTLSIECDKNELINWIEGTTRSINYATIKTVKKLTKDAGQMLLRPTKTWQHEVEARSDIEITDVEVTGIITIEDDPYFYIDRGTTVRRALMSNDWKSKTKPGSLSARAGAGRVVFISKKLNLPGIEARHFLELTKSEIDRKAKIEFMKQYAAQLGKGK